MESSLASYPLRNVYHVFVRLVIIRQLGVVRLASEMKLCMYVRKIGGHGGHIGPSPHILPALFHSPHSSP